MFVFVFVYFRSAIDACVTSSCGCFLHSSGHQSSPPPTSHEIDCTSNPSLKGYYFFCICICTSLTKYRFPHCIWTGFPAFWNQQRTWLHGIRNFLLLWHSDSAFPKRWRHFFPGWKLSASWVVPLVVGLTPGILRDVVNFQSPHLVRPSRLTAGHTPTQPLASPPVFIDALCYLFPWKRWIIRPLIIPGHSRLSHKTTGLHCQPASAY